MVCVLVALSYALALLASPDSMQTSKKGYIIFIMACSICFCMFIAHVDTCSHSLYHSMLARAYLGQVNAKTVSFALLVICASMTL